VMKTDPKSSWLGLSGSVMRVKRRSGRTHVVENVFMGWAVCVLENGLLDCVVWIWHLTPHKLTVCDKKLQPRIAIVATPSIRGNPTVKRANGNACALSSQDNVESLKAYVRTDCQDKNAKKSVMRTIVRVVNCDKRN
jgi:hypothetical protein